MKSKIKGSFWLIWIVVSSVIISESSCKKKERIPKISTDAAQYNADSAWMEFHGTILEIGDNSIIDYGFCWGTTANPTINDHILSKGKNPSIGPFTADTSMTAGSYHVRAYANDGDPVYYGADISFPMQAFLKILPVLQNIGPADSCHHAFVKSNISWKAVSSNPEWLSIKPPDSGTGPMTFILQLCATANNSFDGRSATITATEKGGALSSKATITQSGEIPICATVITQNPHEIGTSTAKVDGNITYLGNSSVVHHGHCWSDTNHFPTISNDTTDLWSASYLGVYTSQLKNLIPGRTYYVRAYATNYAGPCYGNVIDIGALIYIPPQVDYCGISDKTPISAKACGHLKDLGNTKVTQYGHCWSVTNNPTISNYKTTFTDTASIGYFYSQLTGLTPNTIYYYKAYARNSAGTVYSNEDSFSTPDLECPTVTCGDTINVSRTTAIIKGSIDNEGNTLVLEYGHCWSRNPNPLYRSGDDSTTHTYASLLGQYQSTLTGLLPGKTYYARAYARNSCGTIAYSDNQTFFPTDPSPVPYCFCSSLGYVLYAFPTDNFYLAEWGRRGTFINAISPSDGKGNTDKIVLALQNNGGVLYAAKICNDLNTPPTWGFNDWYLPSRYELGCLCDNQSLIGNYSGWYWSSSEIDSTTAWRSTYTSSCYSWADYGKETLGNVRCVRKDAKKK
ncbi:MAG: BACON domain-containing carbohydrate-binding protein [Bacteroidetes bacterium]|nr:BACON domain-containing carbohydrate-binding protein [Bacteroidota bacterium]